MFVTAADHRAGSASAAQQHFKIVQDLGHFQDCGELSHPPSDALDVEVPLNFNDAGNIGDVLRPPRKRFHDDQVFRNRITSAIVSRR